MRCAATVADFLADPVGAYVTGRIWLYYYPRESFGGYFAWGRATGSDFDELAGALAVLLRPTTRSHPLLLDFRGLENIDIGTLRRALHFTQANYDALGRTVTRLALLRSDGIAGAITAGFFRIVPSYCPTEVFTDLQTALQWLDRSEELPFFTALAEECSSDRGAGRWLEPLRSHLESVPNSTLIEAAERLGLSTRSLQRRLAEGGTSFHREVSAARVRVAQRLLCDTDRSISEIAFAVGCASPQHFSTLFRKLAGESPGTWRKRHR